MSLKALYSGLLNPRVDTENVSEEMQNRIFDWGLRHEDWGLLTLLAKIPALAASTDNRLRELDQIDVLQAWATRKGRSSEELVSRVLRDKRVTVLRVVAAIPDLDASVYQTINKVKSPRLGEILAGNPSVPLSIRLARVKEFARRPPRGSYGPHEVTLHKICEADPLSTQAMYEAVAETTQVVPWIVACLQKSYIRPVDVERWVTNLHDILGSSNSDWSSRNGQVVSGLGMHARNPGIRQKLIENVQSWLTLHSGRHSWYTNSVQAAFTALINTADGIEDLYADLKAETDADKATEIVKTIQAKASAGPEMERLASAVALHPYLPLDFVATHISKLGNGRHEAEWRNYVARIERVQDWPMLDTLAETQASINSSYQPYPVRLLGNQLPFLHWMLEERKSQGRQLPDWCSETVLFDRDPLLALTMLRWVHLCSQCSSKPLLAKTVEDRLLQVLGNDQARWEAFTTIGSDFDGSLEDLLEVAKNL